MDEDWEGQPLVGVWDTPEDAMVGTTARLEERETEDREKGWYRCKSMLC